MEFPISKILEAAAPFGRQEICGFIIDGEFVQVENQSRDEGEFVISTRDFVRYSRLASHVVHTHPFIPPTPSDADRAGCRKSALPWLIVNYPTGLYEVLEPDLTYRAPLVGRSWAHGSHDCYGLLRDAYREKFSIELPDYERDWSWWEKGGDLLMDLFGDAGFRELRESEALTHGDVLLMQIYSPVANHCGVFLSPDRILHQVLNHPSKIDVYGGMWQRHTVRRLRHRGLE